MSKKRRKDKQQPAPIAAVDHAPHRGISPMAIATTSVDPRQIRPKTAFVPATPMAGVVPDHVATMAMDDFAANAVAYANTGNLQGGVYTEGMTWLSYPVLAELSQLPEYRRLSEVIAREMTRRWIKFTAIGDEDKSDKIAAIEAAFDRFKIQDLFRHLAELDGFFGRAQLFVDTGYADDPDELLTPLFISASKIGKGGLKRLAVVEPIFSYPAGYNSSNPLAPHFYDPQEWWVMGQRVHKSRLLTFVSRQMPTFLRPAYSFGGLSLSQMAKPYIDSFLRTKRSITELIHSFSVSGIKTNMAATMGGTGGEDIVSRAMLFNQMRDNRGLLMLDKETEEFFNITTPLGTLDQLLAQSQEQIASICGVPLVILLGIAPSGLNASSDGEIRVFYDSIHAQQEHLFGRHLRTILRIVQLSEFGEIDDDISFRFEQLWQPNDAEVASIRKIDADVAMGYVNAGIIAPEEERQRLATTEGSVYHGLDVSAVPDPPETELDPLAEADPAEGEVDAGNEAGSPGA